MSQLTVRKTGGLTLKGSLRPLIFVAGLVSLNPQISGAGSNPGQQTFGPADALHVVVAGNSSSGYRAEIYDGNQLVTTRGLAGKYDLTVFPGTSDNQPTGPNILTDPTAVGSWQGPFQNGVGSGTGHDSGRNHSGWNAGDPMDDDQCRSQYSCRPGTNSIRD
jgi:hypothetical protein